jgi:hypothetical protein
MIDSQLAILLQAKDYLTSVSQAQYTEIIKPYFISSAGGHVRHILDHYLAIMAGITTKHIDYDQRHREHLIESDPIAALSCIENIMQWFHTLTNEQLNETIQLSTEIDIHQQRKAVVNTTLARELVFAGSHAVHHFAMIAQIAHHQHVNLPEYFGLAPATASYLRQQHSH